MKPESDVNPYAAPQSDVTPIREPEAPMKRPASTKWAIVVAVLFLIVYALTQGPANTDDTSAEWHFSLINGVDLGIRVVCLVVLLAGRRRPWGYYLSAIILSAFWLNGVKNLWVFTTYTPGKVDWEAAVGGGIFMSLFAYLLYRFIYCLPSRQFYRVS
jgi:membrane associated rhomboid family serine protease